MTMWIDDEGGIWKHNRGEDWQLMAEGDKSYWATMSQGINWVDLKVSQDERDFARESYEVWMAGKRPTAS